MIFGQIFEVFLNRLSINLHRRSNPDLQQLCYGYGFMPSTSLATQCSCLWSIIRYGPASVHKNLSIKQKVLENQSSIFSDRVRGSVLRYMNRRPMNTRSRVVAIPITRIEAIRLTLQFKDNKGPLDLKNLLKRSLRFSKSRGTGILQSFL